MRGFSLLSHAKINLALEVISRRRDGFHSIRTVFERVSLFDTLTFSPAPAGEVRVSCDDRRVPCDERNLVLKAARLLQEGEGADRGARIHIQKRIPVAAGLAGGSSNAATALLGFNRLWGLGLSREKLIAYADRLGSDVAFFLHDAPFAVGTGRGERIRPVASRLRLWHVLVTPRAPVLTKDVYAALGLRPGDGNSRRVSSMKNVVHGLVRRDADRVRQGLSNDLEPAILQVRPALLKLKKRMVALARDGVCFSGSGPTVFAVTRTKADAERIAVLFRRQYGQVFVAATF
ncbi:MAG: 4-(cytidine 5'-diphospho)-2-C-methyl-D-erythritol kinase [Elusimicrobia bacterium]|nr:4-(cytidine 5'-diphospho)-2-C-methyl-D-erythritol kinase [Elusimicrobiota bacterium]